MSLFFSVSGFTQWNKPAIRQLFNSSQHTHTHTHHVQAVWRLFEYPETSRSAFIIAVISVTMTLVAIVKSHLHAVMQPSQCRRQGLRWSS